MSKKAEAAAQKAYPKEDGKMWHSAFGTLEFDKNAQARKAYQEGYEQAEKELGWHSVKESLPALDEEVIVLTDNTNGKSFPGMTRICYGYIPNPERSLKDVSTGEVKHYKTVTYDGWNIPGVKYWMPFPKIPKKK